MGKLSNIRRTKMQAQSGRCYYCDLPMWDPEMDPAVPEICRAPALRRYLRCTAEHLQPRSDGGAVRSAPRTGTHGDGRNADRRTAAERRQERAGVTKPLKDALRAAEKRWQKAEDTVTSLEKKLADPDLYDRPEEVTEVAHRHDQAKAEAAQAMKAFEKAAEKLEAADARFAP